MIWPPFRARYLPAMSLRQIQELPNKSGAYVILSTGAIEQHGPHLPVGVDALLGQIFLTHSLSLLPKEAPVYVAPPIQIAKSDEHTGFPGTLIISRESLRRQVISIADQLAEWGFFRLGIINTHGGNLTVLKSVIREVNLCAKLNIELIKFDTQSPMHSPSETAFGIHAGEFESSIIYAATPSLVKPEHATCEWIGNLESNRQLRAEFSPATYAWKTLDLSESGVMGDARKASVEKGQRWIAEVARSMANDITGRLKN